MNPHDEKSLSPLFLARSVLNNSGLLASLIRRDIAGRYRGSAMGLTWSFLNPLLMLGVYTFVFGSVFKTRWPGGDESKSSFALLLFAGLLVFNMFSECISRAPTLVSSNVNYVKKVIFPLELLPIVAFGASGFHLLIGLIAWLLFYVLVIGVPPISIIWFPIVILPLVITILGLSWLLCSLGVYFRDLAQLTNSLLPILMFLSPIFYPSDALPEHYHALFQFNPLSYAVEQTRDVLFYGRHIDIQRWGKEILLSASIFVSGFAWFQITRKGFADVV